MKFWELIISWRKSTRGCKQKEISMKESYLWSHRQIRSAVFNLFPESMAPYRAEVWLVLPESSVNQHSPTDLGKHDVSQTETQPSIQLLSGPHSLRPLVSLSFETASLPKSCLLSLLSHLFAQEKSMILFLFFLPILILNELSHKLIPSHLQSSLAVFLEACSMPWPSQNLIQSSVTSWVQNPCPLQTSLCWPPVFMEANLG